METEFKINQEVYVLVNGYKPAKAKIIKVVIDTQKTVYYVSLIEGYVYDSELLFERGESDLFATPEDLKNYFIQLIDNL